MLLKRLVISPLFWVLIVLLVICTLALGAVSASDSSLVTVLLYDKCNSEISSSLISDLTALSNSAIEFKTAGSEEEIRTQVYYEKAQAGYVFYKDFDKRLKEFPTDHNPPVKCIRNKNEQSVKIVDELVSGRVYRYLAPEITSAYMLQMSGLRSFDPADADEYVRAQYLSYDNIRIPFRFETAEGEIHSALDSGRIGDHNAILLSPLRIMIMVWIMVCALSGGVFYYSDERNRLFTCMSQGNRSILRLIYIAVPTFVAGIAGVISLFISGAAALTIKEIVSMMLYLIILTIVVFAIQLIVRKETIYISLIPVSVLCAIAGYMLLTM